MTSQELKKLIRRQGRVNTTLLMLGAFDPGQSVSDVCRDLLNESIEVSKEIKAGLTASGGIIKPR